MAMEINKAKREKTHAIIMLSGESGGGKTYSALQIAKGLAGDGKIGFIDTENRRGRHYADVVPFDVIDLGPPFTSQRYLQAIKAFEEQSYPVIVIDSMSHEWEGIGGCIDQAQAIEDKTGKPGMHCWVKPKAAHKQLIDHLLQLNMHVICCCRAKEKFEQRYNDKGKQEIVSTGVEPRQEKDFKYEATLSLMVHPDNPGVPEYVKVPEQLAEAVPKGKRMNVHTGEVIKAWCDAVEDEAPKKQTPEEWVVKAKGEINSCSSEDQLSAWYKKNMKAVHALLDKNETLGSELQHHYDNKVDELKLEIKI